jgi:hypothetical protein
MSYPRASACIGVHRPASALNLACLAGRRSVLRGTPDAACQPEPRYPATPHDSSGRPHHRDAAEAAGKASKKWNHRCTPMGCSSACSFRAEPSRPRLMSSAAALVRSPSVCIGMHLWFHFLACLAACRTLPNGRLDRAAPPGPHPAHPIEPLPGTEPASTTRHRDDWFSARSPGDATPCQADRTLKSSRHKPSHRAPAAAAPHAPERRSPGWSYRSDSARICLTWKLLAYRRATPPPQYAEPLPRRGPDGSNKEESRCNWPRY